MRETQEKNMFLTFKEFCERKRSIIVIKNPEDNLCLPRAIMVAKAVVYGALGYTPGTQAPASLLARGKSEVHGRSIEKYFFACIFIFGENIFQHKKKF